MLHHPDDLDDDQQVQLKEVRTACPHLDVSAGHVTEFAKILIGRHGEQLDAWIAAVEADELPHLHRFVRGPTRSSMDLPCRTTPVRWKATSTAFKMIKRQMYGRANFDLLRILHAV